MRTQISKECMRLVMDAILEYFDEVGASGNLTDKTKQTYSDHATQVARFMMGEFQPGGGGPNQPGVNKREHIEALKSLLWQ